VFLGHFGVGFGAKAAAPKTSLGTLFLAAQFVDLLWPTFLLLGVEHARIDPGATVVTPLDFTDYPWSHSLIAGIGWGLLFAAVYFLVRRYRAGAIVAGAAVLSHWLLDLVVHRPDLPLLFSGPKVGLGLWNSLPATLLVELAIFLGGLAVYVRTTRPRDRTGTIALWLLVGFLAAVYLANVFGPPPPDIRAVAIAGQAQWLLIAWGYWIDRHRLPEVTVTSQA
jgi:uncharacterized membrane protein YhaH (DUF805 family)